MKLHQDNRTVTATLIRRVILGHKNVFRKKDWDKMLTAYSDP
jgi:hypothetical protein